MIFVYFAFIVVLMTLDTTELPEIATGNMAVVANIPFSVVSATVNGEILCIMVECRRGP